MVLNYLTCRMKFIAFSLTSKVLNMVYICKYGFLLLFNMNSPLWSFYLCFERKSCHVVQAGLEHSMLFRLSSNSILLPQPLKCWDYRYAPSHPAWLLYLNHISYFKHLCKLQCQFYLCVWPVQMCTFSRSISRSIFCVQGSIMVTWDES
jgi:hypothetical protein